MIAVLVSAAVSLLLISSPPASLFGLTWLALPVQGEVDITEVFVVLEIRLCNNGGGGGKGGVKNERQGLYLKCGGQWIGPPYGFGNAWVL